MLPRVIIISSCSLRRESQLWNTFYSSLKTKHWAFLFQVCFPVQAAVLVDRPRFEKIKLKWKCAFWVTVNKPPPRSAEGLDGARCPGAVDVIPAGTSGCYSPPDRAATSCALAAGPEVCWSGCSVRSCSPTQRGRAVSYRPWSRWRWGCAPGEPRHFCTASWIWTSGFGTKSWPGRVTLMLIVMLKMQNKRKATEKKLHFSNITLL